MKKFLAVASATLLFSSVASVSVAHHRSDHDANNHGMCTAYFSGSENGQGNKRENGTAFSAFEAFVAGAENGGDFDDDGDIDAYDVANYCNNATGGFGNPGGGNDPFFGDSTCGFDEDSDGYADEDGNGQDDRCDALENQEGGTTPGESNGNNKNKGGGN